MSELLRIVTERRFCKETGQPPTHSKPFGYVIQIIPPRVTYQKGQDIEGIGWHEWREPKRMVRHTIGWYKRKSTAIRRWNEYHGNRLCLFR